MNSSVRIFTPPAASLAVRNKLEANLELEVDVVVVGAGITGLTAALRLAEMGKRTVVLEARTIGSGTTSGTTAHITEAVDTRYVDIESKFGAEGAKAVAESSRSAIEHIARRVEGLGIACDFQRVPGFLYSESGSDQERDLLSREYEAATRAGLKVSLDASPPLSFAAKAGSSLRFDDQAQFHAGRYLAGIAEAAERIGVRIFEGSRVLAVDETEPCVVHLENGAVVRARAVFFATHVPLNRLFLQTKLESNRSYVVALRNVPQDRIAAALYWDLADPYHYLRTIDLDGTPHVLVGGEDHRTGTEENTEVHFDNLLKFARERFGAGDVSYRYSEQVLEPVDGLPFIGRNSMSEHVYVATGFSGNGMTFGTLAALMVSDLILERPNPWTSLYSATRVKPIAGAKPFLRNSLESAAHLIGDRLAPPEVASLRDIGRDEGKTVRVKGERLAVYRDGGGSLHAVSSVCTHLGCLVKFNHAERTWDCPCHGSRFGVDGAVITGPATEPLSKREVEDESGPPIEGVGVPVFVG